MPQLPELLFVSKILVGGHLVGDGKRSRKSRPADEHFISLSARQNKSKNDSRKSVNSVRSFKWSA